MLCVFCALFGVQRVLYSVHFDNTISECGGRWGHADNLITLCTHCVTFLGNMCFLKYKMCIACYELYAMHKMN